MKRRTDMDTVSLSKIFESLDDTVDRDEIRGITLRLSQFSSLNARTFDARSNAWRTCLT